MAVSSKPAFAFTVSGLAPETFHVVRFTGSEGLSKLYEFDITLVAGTQSVDLDQALAGEACLTVRRDGAEDLAWHGVLRSLRLSQVGGPHTFYRAVLAPKAWLLTQSQGCALYLNQNLTQNIRQCLAAGGLADGLDFELATQSSYPRREYVCQFNESPFHFVSRWMERNGLYFFFDQTGPREKLCIVDNLSAHAPSPGGEALAFAAVSGLDAGLTGRAVKSFQREQRRVPREVRVKDTNYRTPNLDIQSVAQVAEGGEGCVYAYGGHMRSLRQAAFLAGVRAEGLRCRRTAFFGESNAPFLSPGRLASLEGHPLEEFNRQYLVVDVRHEGSQEAWLTAGLGVETGGDKLFYRNAFAAIPSDVQFRPEQTASRPVIRGTILAKIDAESSGKYAEVDELGRYKVIMPFDLSGRKDGRASTWLRMIQPYAGPGHGMHLPLHKGTEVAIIHQEGDPDRPLILGALHNPAAPPVLDADTQTQARITTAGGNLIHMEDREGAQRILLHSTPDGNFLRIGAPNDPPAPDFPESASPGADKAAAAAIGDTVETMATKGITLVTPQWFTLKAAIANTVILGENTSTVLGFSSSNAVGGFLKVTVGVSTEIKCAYHTEFAPFWKEMRASVLQVEADKKQVIADLQSAVANHDTVIGQHTQTIADQTKVIARRTKAIASLSETVGDQQRMVASHTALLGQHTRTIGQMETTAGQHTQTLGQHTRTLGQLETTAGQHTQTLGQLQQTAGQITSISEDVSNLWAVTSIVAGEVGFV